MLRRFAPLALLAAAACAPESNQIGRASCRERV